MICPNRQWPTTYLAGFSGILAPLLVEHEHTRAVAIEMIRSAMSCKNILCLLFVADGLGSAILQASTL